MDHAANALWVANNIYIRQSNTTSNGTTTANPETATRPPVYKAIGISLAIASGVFIGISFVLKKVGLLKANVKYNEEAGEGYGYLKNFYWWGGMTLMIIGEICNFVAYAFVDAILVTPMGAISVVITAVLSAIFLKERLSMVGKIGCFLCIIGSVVIVLNAPAESSAANIQEMQHFVIAPGFLSFAGVIILACAFLAFWVAPRYGKKSMLVYLSICSLIGGLSVVATQGLGAAIIAQIGGTPQFNQWFLYVLFVFVVATLLTEIVYLNKALNIFNAALVTPTYYVIFTSATIITSAILFRGFKGTVVSILTMVMGFFTICAGVVLLQLSKSAKDVPDTAVFAGDLDQIRTIAEQEQSETEPKADAIRGSGLGTIVRRFSVTRNKMELEEARRLHEEKQAELESIGENEQYEWDGLRRRKTTLQKSSVGSFRPIPKIRTFASLDSPDIPRSGTADSTARQHPPLGMSRFPSYDEMQEDEEARPTTGNTASTGNLGSSFFGSIRDRARSTFAPNTSTRDFARQGGEQSPMHPVPLTEIALPHYKGDHPSGYYDNNREHTFGLPRGLQHDQNTSYLGADIGDRDRLNSSSSKEVHIHFDDTTLQHPGTGGTAPEPPPHSARRQFSFHNVFRKATHDEEPLPRKEGVPRKTIGSRGREHIPVKGATEEERLGLVKGDTNTMQSGRYDGDDDDLDRQSTDSTESWELEGKTKMATASAIPVIERGRGRKFSVEEEREDLKLAKRYSAQDKEEGASHPAEGSGRSSEEDEYEKRRRRWEKQGRTTPPNRTGGGGGKGATGAFI